MGWLIAAAVIVLLACISIGVRIRYDTDGLTVSLLAGMLRFKVFPRSKQAKKGKKAPGSPEKPAKAKKEKNGEEEKKASGGSITDFIPLVKTAVDFLNAFRRKIRIDRLQLNLVLGGGDPADLAMNYGRGWSVLGSLVPLLEQVFVIKKRDLEVQCDFTAERTTVFVAADIRITVFRLLSLGVCFGIRALKEYFNIMNKRKGGANS